MNTQEYNIRIKAPDIRNSEIFSNPYNGKDDNKDGYISKAESTG